MLNIPYATTPFSQSSLIFHDSGPGQAEHLSSMPGDANLVLPIGTPDAGGDLLSLPLQDDLVLRNLGEPVEAASIAAEEVLELLLGDVGVGDDAPLDGLLEAEKDELRHVRLGEDAGGCLALLGRGLGLEGVRGAVASTNRRW